MNGVVRRQLVLIGRRTGEPATAMRFLVVARLGLGLPPSDVELVAASVLRVGELAAQRAKVLFDSAVPVPPHGEVLLGSLEREQDRRGVALAIDVEPRASTGRATLQLARRAVDRVEANLERATSPSDVVRLAGERGFQLSEKDVISALTSTHWYKPEILGDELDHTAGMHALPPTWTEETQKSCGTTMTWNHCYSC